MHISLLLGLLVCQTPEAVDSPRIQPLPFQITFQTKRKPVFQDAPPSTFVPPSSSGANQSFDPKGQFQTQKDEKLDALGSGFQKVDPDKVKPLRGSSLPQSKSPSSGFSLQSEVESDAKKSSGFNPTDQGFDGKASNVKRFDSNPSEFSQSNKTSGASQSQSTDTNSLNLQSKTNSPSTYSSKPNSISQPTNIQSAPRQRNSFNQLQSKTASPNSIDLTPQQTEPGDQRLNSLESRSTESRSTESQSTAGLNQAPRKLVKETPDPTYDPQLREITELILKTIPRPDRNRLSLQQAVAYARSADHRKQIIKQYWSCFVTMADQTFAERELQLLSEVPSPRTQLDQFLLRAANSAAQARYVEAKIAYQKSAAALHRLAPRFSLDTPLSFADLPWVGKYQTNSEGFVTAGLFSNRIRKVDLALPAIRDLIYLRGAAVYDNMAALRESMAGYENGSVKLETLLGLHKEIRDQRIEFCKNIRSYNHAIADYAISVFPNARNPLTVANMLIDTKKTLSTAPFRDPSVRQASGQAPIQNQVK